MPGDERLTWDLFFEVLGVLERHGYRRSDNQHAAQVIGLIHDVTHIYEGTLDASSTPYVVVLSSRPVAPQSPGPPGVIVSTGQVKTLLAALDEAAEYKRGRAETCADCADQSCSTCHRCLQAANACDRLADQMTQAAEASAARHRASHHAAPARDEPHAAVEPEARQ